MIPFILTLALLGQDESAYDKAVESVVRLRIIDAKGRATVATGVVVGEGKILTAHHAVKGAVKILADAPIRSDGVVDADPTSYRGGVPCALSAQSPGRDLALLATARVGTPIPLAARTAPPGSGVFAIGNGPALFRYSGGCVRQSIPGTVGGIRGRMVECALANSVGDSGGPVVNRRGELVGVVCYGDLQAIRAIDISEIRGFLLEGK